MRKAGESRLLRTNEVLDAERYVVKEPFIDTFGGVVLQRCQDEAVRRRRDGGRKASLKRLYEDCCLRGQRGRLRAQSSRERVYR